MKVAHAEVVKVAALIFFVLKVQLTEVMNHYHDVDAVLQLQQASATNSSGDDDDVCSVLCISNAKAAFSSAFGANREKAIVTREKKQ